MSDVLACNIETAPDLRVFAAAMVLRAKPGVVLGSREGVFPQHGLLS
jgi:hypothetical protein